MNSKSEGRQNIFRSCDREFGWVGFDGEGFHGVTLGNECVALQDDQVSNPNKETLMIRTRERGFPRTGLASKASPIEAEKVALSSAIKWTSVKCRDQKERQK